MGLRRTLLLILLGAAWATEPSVAQERREGLGSMAPCRAPLAWTVGAVDARFGLTADDVLAAASEAARLWEDATGVDLFDVRPSGRDGFPISLHYDGRQATAEHRRRLRTELDSAREELERRRLVLEAESARYDSARAAYARDVEEHRRAMNDYNDTVQEWNRRGGAPDEVRVRLEARLAGLDAIGEGLRDRETELDGVARRLGEEVRALNSGISGLERREERFARDYARTVSESGRYDETVTWEGDRVRSVERAIRVFQVTGERDLVLVLAHELGHALGLGHAAGPGTVMSETMETGVGGALPPGVTGADVRMLVALCPQWKGKSSLPSP